MGGAFGLDHHTLAEPKVGNMEPNNPFSEANAFCDSEAADLVLSSGMPITLLPLDVTHQLICTPERFDFLDNLASFQTSSVLLTLLHKAMEGMNEFYQTVDFHNSPIHDLNVGIYLRTIFSSQRIVCTCEDQS